MSVKFNVVGYTDRRTDDLKQRGDALEQRQSRSASADHGEASLAADLPQHAHL
jgi:hypothetical protein